MHQAIIITAKYAVIIPPFAYLVLLFLQRKSPKKLLIFTIFSIVLALILVKLATTIHSDPRPFVRDGVTPYFASSTDNGFPSDHTVFSTLLACIILKYYRMAAVLLLLVSVLIGSARVISGVHHGQDVVGGVFIASLSVYAASRLTDLAVRKTTSTETH